MSVLFIILPLALFMAVLAVTAFIVSARRGQFDDLDSPPWRAIFNDDAAGTHGPQSRSKQ